jgi:hypothetical protein
MAVLIDFESIVAKCTRKIEDPTTPASVIHQKYVERAYARLMSGHGVGKSIEDCSRILNLPSALDMQKSLACAIRAYAYFIDNNYLQALDDCERFKKTYAKSKKQSNPKTKRFVNELWCRLLQKKQEHKEALNKIRIYLKKGCLNAPDFLLSEQYRELRDYLKKEW